MNHKPNTGPIKHFDIGPDKQLVVYKQEACGFAEMRICDREGDFMPVTMNELLNAVSAAYYCQKDKK